MSEKSTPSFAEFVRRHRAAEGMTVHDQAEQAATCTFDWVGATAAGIAECSVGVLHHHRNDAREGDAREQLIVRVKKTVIEPR